MGPPSSFFKACFVYFSVTTASVLKPRVSTEPSSTNLVLPVNITNWLEHHNENTSHDDTTILPDLSTHDDNIIWPESWTPPPSSIYPLNTTSFNTTLVGAPKLSCNGKAYGKNLNVASCIEAYNILKTGSDNTFFGERGHGRFDAQLPFRVLSTDGRCAIDISHKAGVWSDTITPSELKQSASLVLEICVKGKPSIGGVVSEIGQAGNLAIRFTPYRPTVHCDHPGMSPPWGDCRNIIDFMPTEGTKQRFGQKSDPDPDITVRLPAGFHTELKRCEVFVDTLLPDVGQDSYDWYKLWAAANAVDYMCVGRGRSGIAIGLGEKKSLFLELKDLTAPPRPSALPPIAVS